MSEIDPLQAPSTMTEKNFRFFFMETVTVTPKMIIFKTLTRLSVICFAGLSLADTAGFIFPANDTQLEAPLSDIIVHFNDSIVIEYTGNPRGIVLLGQYCYASSQNPLNESSDNPQTSYLSSSCEWINIQS
jgi:hypothetical protein